MQLEVGAIVEGKVTGISKFGAFVELSDGKVGMIHISEVSTDFVRDINDYLQKGQEVKAKVIGISEKNEIALSIKKLMPDKPNRTPTGPFNKKRFDSKVGRYNNFERKGTKQNSASSFEEMLSSFKHASEEKISDLKRTKESKRGSGSRRGSQR